MATYKVIQDIEAEDKLIGWMTPRQTIYAAIVLVSLFIGFMVATRGAWWLALPLLPHTILFGVLAGPFVHDQPSEVWLLAKIKFFLMPRRRIWDQNGLKELVTITVPKKIERRLTDGLSQTEVKSRLQALANTIDSRGWAVKNVNVNLFAQPGYAGASTDRLIDTSTIPQEVPSFDVSAQDDMLDERSNPTAQHLQQMIDESSQVRRRQAVATMQKPSKQGKQDTPADYWFLNAAAGQQAPTQPGYATFGHSQTVAPGSTTVSQAAAVAGPSTDDQEALLEKLRKEKERTAPGNNHLRTIKPISEQTKKHKTHHDKPEDLQAQQIKPANQQLAQDNNLSVATIAKQAKGGDEVIISLR